nr:hypothetical protein Iba_chr10bCG7680 [Ipomoea batatas]
MCSSLPSWTRREQLRASKLLSSHHASFPVGKGLPLLIVMDPTDGCALSSSSPRLTSGSDPLGGCSLSSKSSSAGVTLVRATRCLCLNIMLPRIKKKESNICCAVGYTLEFGEAWRIPGIKEEESRRRRRTRNLVG